MAGARTFGRVACAALVCVAASAASAHEIGTTRVSIVVEEDRTYEAEIATDAAALVAKLEAAAGQRRAAPADPDHLRELIPTFDQVFRRRVHLAFDGAEVSPQVIYRVTPGADGAAAATITLTGRAPAGARTVTWAYGWTFASYALTVRHAGGATTEWLEGDQPSARVVLATRAAGSSRLRTALRYVRLGFTHIVPHGPDHILFVLGIYLLSGRRRSVLAQVSAFTIAHSITLGLSMYGLLAVSARAVEPLIAVSIAYVAIENVVIADLKAWRVALVFMFGLLHGMGFAGALTEVGLPRSEFLTALVSFNTGVEAGQLTVIAAAFALVGWWCSHQAWYRRRVVVPASVLIASVAVFWTIQRLSG